MNSAEQAKLRDEVNEKLLITNIIEDIAVELDKRMRDKSFTARSLGVISGVSNMSIRRVLSQKQNISIEHLHRICLALDITLSEFLSSTGWAPPENEN